MRSILYMRRISVMVTRQGYHEVTVIVTGTPNHRPKNHCVGDKERFV